MNVARPAHTSHQACESSKKGETALRQAAHWLLLAIVMSALSITAIAARKDQAAKKPSAPAYALIFGNVFDPGDRLFAGAEVKIRRENERRPRWETRSDARGEFAVRLPAGPGRYVLTLRAKGYADELKTFAVENDERIDLSFRLRPATSGGER